MNTMHAAIQQLNQVVPDSEMAWKQFFQEYFPDKISPDYKSRFLVKKGHQLISLAVSEIRYFYLRDKLTFAKMSDNKDHILDYTITEIEKLICPERFFRVSRQFIISHEAIEKVLVSTHGKLRVEVKPLHPEPIIISRERVPTFKTWMGE
ncbi:MAG: LytTR family transcriptional regulator DNA-binding domain-containing protein [Chitinophagaceae bacterium]|nr:LytTR family transcriptional regulator DNA-binding domain-containing protein [Chitinophagaceae bacterium]